MPAQRRSRLRRAAAAQLRALARSTGSRRALPRAVRAHPGRRVPGHERHPVRLDQGARRAGRAYRSWSATTTSRSIAGAARGSRTCSSSARISPACSSSASSRTTARPATSWPPPTRSSPTTAGASARSSGPAASAARRSASTAPTTSVTKPSSSSAASATGSRAAASARHRDPVPLECAVARVRGIPARRRASRIASTGACGSSSAPEIKDALAYLRLICNRDDDASFERVVNLPDARHRHTHTRGAARTCARQRDLAVAGEQPPAGEELGARKATACLQAFLALIEQLDAATRGLPLHEQVDHVIQASGLVAHYRRRRRTRARRGSRTSRNSSARRAASSPRTRACRRSRRSSRTRCSSRAKARPRPGRTACR